MHSVHGMLLWPRAAHAHYDALLGMNASAPLPVTTRRVGRTGWAQFGAAKILLTPRWFRIRSMAAWEGLMRRSTTVKAALAKGTEQISLQALLL